jgi:hypothetical protein
VRVVQPAQHLHLGRKLALALHAAQVLHLRGARRGAGAGVGGSRGDGGERRSAPQLGAMHAAAAHLDGDRRQVKHGAVHATEAPLPDDPQRVEAARGLRQLGQAILAQPAHRAPGAPDAPPATGCSSIASRDLLAPPGPRGPCRCVRRAQRQPRPLQLALVRRSGASRRHDMKDGSRRAAGGACGGSQRRVWARASVQMGVSRRGRRGTRDRTSAVVACQGGSALVLARAAPARGQAAASECKPHTAPQCTAPPPPTSSFGPAWHPRPRHRPAALSRPQPPPDALRSLDLRKCSICWRGPGTAVSAAAMDCEGAQMELLLAASVRARCWEWLAPERVAAAFAAVPVEARGGRARCWEWLAPEPMAAAFAAVPV